jgi:hypothetical protein
MVKKKRKKVIVGIVLVILFIIVYLIAAGIVSYYQISRRNPLLNEKIANADYVYLYSLYLASNPNITNRPFYGDKDAGVTIIAVLDMNSEDSRYFMKEIFPVIEEEFLETGIAKYYHKDYILLKDIEQKNNRFKYAKALLCIKFLKEDEYYNFYFDLLGQNKVNDLVPLVEKYNISIGDFVDCMENMDNGIIIHDAIESENYGKGISQKFYIGYKGTDNSVLEGIPSYDIFRREVINYQLLIGG